MEVSKSGFYGYLSRKKSNARIERGALEGFAVEAFERRKGRYGYRRIDRELRKSGISVSEKRVLRTMRKLGLAGKGATRKHRIQEKVEPGDPRLNLAERAFAVGERNRLWAGGIACMPAREGRLYLAAVTGAFSRKVAGWSMSGRITGKVAIDAIGRAVGGEGPPDDGKPRLPWRPRRAARLPLLPAMPGLAWRSPVGIKARHAAGQRGGRVVLQDAEKGIGGREELWDEGRGQAGHLQVHRALLQ